MRRFTSKDAHARRQVRGQAFPKTRTFEKKSKNGPKFIRMVDAVSIFCIRYRVEHVKQRLLFAHDVGPE